MAVDIFSVIIGFVGGIIGAVSGGIATYFAERKLEKRREKNTNNERIYFPLLDELEIARNDVNTFSRPFLTIWPQILNQHLQYIISSGIRGRMGELSNSITRFSNGVYVTSEKIKEIAEQELSNRRLDKDNINYIQEGGTRIHLNTYIPFINLTENLAKYIIVRKEDSGFSANAKDINFFLETYKNDLNKLKHDFNLEFSSLEEYIDFVYSRVKELPTFMQMKKEMPEIVANIDSLISEIENQTK